MTTFTPPDDADPDEIDYEDLKGTRVRYEYIPIREIFVGADGKEEIETEETTGTIEAVNHDAGLLDVALYARSEETGETHPIVPNHIIEIDPDTDQ